MRMPLVEGVGAYRGWDWGKMAADGNGMGGGSRDSIPAGRKGNSGEYLRIVKAQLWQNVGWLMKVQLVW
jgi:hypothetical protein